MFKYIRKFWFLYGLIICPILIVLSLFYIGYQVGNIAYSEKSFSVEVWHLLMISVLLLSLSEFRRTMSTLKK